MVAELKRSLRAIINERWTWPDCPACGEVGCRGTMRRMRRPAGAYHEVYQCAKCGYIFAPQRAEGAD